MCKNVWLHVCKCATCVRWLRKRKSSCGTGVKISCYVPHGYWEQNLGAMQTPLSAEPSLQPRHLLLVTTFGLAGWLPPSHLSFSSICHFHHVNTHSRAKSELKTWVSHTLELGRINSRLAHTGAASTPAHHCLFYLGQPFYSDLPARSPSHNPEGWGVSKNCLLTLTLFYISDF